MKLQKLQRKCSSFFNELQQYVFESSKVLPICCLLAGFEVLLCCFIIFKVKYTEIDWMAYMEEVEGFLNGTYNYMKLKGQTGPLVYPAGFVYIFSILYKATSQGENILLAQYLFAVLYILNLCLVFNIYRITRKVPPYALVFMCCTSYRIHSIYVLRLFNDPVAMLFLYAAVNALLYNRFSLGCILFSVGVSVKMNILLFAPGLLVVLLLYRGLWETVGHLAECAIIQVLVGMPFLVHNSSSYLTRAFEFQRQFLFKWTVNYRFLPVWLFEDRLFHFALLLGQVLALLLFFWLFIKCRGGLRTFTEINAPKARQIIPHDVVYPMFVSNFIGVMFSRSLHYQFYVWYFHTLTYLLWCTNLRPMLKLLILGVIELSWNTYPSTCESSAALHLSHIVMFAVLVRAAVSDPGDKFSIKLQYKPDTKSS